MAVSSANVLSIVLLDVGRSAVYIVYKSGPRMLPWGTPESTGNRDDVSLLNFVTQYLSCRYDFNNLKISFLSSRRVKACRFSGGWVCVVISLSTSGS